MDLEERIREAFVPVENGSSLRTIKRLAQRRTRVRRRVGLVAAAAGLSIVAVALPFAVPGPGEHEANATTMAQLAGVVRSQPIILVEDGQYLYTETLGTRDNCVGNVCRLDRVRRQVWAATDGSGRMAGSSSVDGSWSELMRPGELGGSLQEALPPTDPDELRAFIEERASMAEQPLDWEMWVIMTDLLGETFSSPILYSTPELRAALFDVAATLPGVEDLGAMTDAIGREGIGFGFTGGYERMELIFDRETATILEMRQIPVHDFPDGSSMEGVAWTVFLDVGVVDSVRDRL